jgi:hypothetical protein
MGSVNKRLLNPCILIVCAAAILAAAGPAAADVVPAGTGEPLYTNSTQNTQWFQVTKPTGIGSYRLRYSYYANNALVNEVTINNATSGLTWANWSGVANLQHGGQYGICVQGEYTFPNDSLWIPDGPNSCSMGTQLGRRSYTIIDRSKPSAAIEAAGGAATTKDASIPVSIAFSDDVAGPYPANFTCVSAGSDPCGTMDYSPSCSAPAGGGKSTTFTCNVDASQLPDGPVTICVISADASVPDNPSSANQSGSAMQANHSDEKCDTVTLDRSVPTPPGGGTPDPGTPDTDTPNPGAPAPGESAGIPGGLQIGSLSILVPRKVKIGKTKQLVIGAHASQAGQLSLRLVRGKKVVSRLSVGLSAGQTKQRLRLPRRLRAGTYTVKIAFKAIGTSWAATGATKVSARR